MKAVQETACVIERTSTKRQTPGLQSPENARWIREHGYRLHREGTFTLRESASKDSPKHKQVLADVIEGARQGKWTVVVVVAMDRIERHGVWAFIGFLIDLYRAGCRVESTDPDEAWLADTADEARWFDNVNREADRAKREAEIRRRKTGFGHAEKDRLGQGRYRLPLGWKYRVPKVKFGGEILTDRKGQTAVRAAFRAVANGGTLKDGSRAMAEKGVPRSAEQVSAIIRNMCYSTGILMVPVPVEVKPVVSETTQLKAIAVLRDRLSYSGPRTRDTEAESFGGRIFCQAHGKPLHTWKAPVRKDGTRKLYYRARGCDCGLFSAEPVDEGIIAMMHADGVSEPELEYAVTGQDTAAKAARIEQEMSQVFRTRPEGWTTTLAELEAQKAALEAAEPVRGMRETGRSVGDAWLAMDRREQRRYLARNAEAGIFRVVIAKSKLAGGEVIYWAAIDRQPDESIR